MEATAIKLAHKDEKTRIYLRNDHMMENLEDGSVDIILTDPPYGISYQSSHRIVKMNTISDDNNLYWVDGALSEMYRVMKENSALFLFTRWDVYSDWVPKVEKYFNLKNCIVWWKQGGGGMGDLNSAFAPEHEFIIYATKGSIRLSRRVADFVAHDKIPPPQKLHPTEKPVGLMSRLILSLDNPDLDYSKQLIVDPYMGCGATLVAAKQLGRNAVGYEKDPEGMDYVKVATRRLQQFVMDLGV